MIIIILFCVFCHYVGYSRATSFYTVVGGGLSEQVISTSQTTDGGFIVGGYSNSYGAGNWDFFIAKFSGNGSFTWATVVGGGGVDQAWSVKQTSDEGYILVGATASFEATSVIMLSKFDSDGSHTWTKTLGGASGDTGRSVQETRDGGFIVTGFTIYLATYHVILSKFESDGSHTWSKEFGGIGDDRGHAVQQTSDDGYIVTGYTSSFGAGSQSILLIKFASDGSHNWTSTLGGTLNDYAQMVAQTNDGGYIVTGTTASFTGTKMILSKFNSDGTHNWTKAGVGTYGWDVRQTRDGGFIVAGIGDESGYGLFDAVASKFDSDGTLIWSRSLGGGSNDYGLSAQETTVDGEFIVAGYTASFGAGEDDLFLALINSTGGCNGLPYSSTVISPAVVFESIGDNTTDITGVMSLVVRSPTINNWVPSSVYECLWEEDDPIPEEESTTSNHSCFGILASNHDAVCSGHGICNEDGTCECEEGYATEECSETSFFQFISGDEISSSSIDLGCFVDGSTPGGREGGCGFAFGNGEIYYFGGKSYNEVYYNDVWILKLDPNVSSSNPAAWCKVSGANQSHYIDGVVEGNNNEYDPLNQIGTRASFGSVATYFSFLVFGGKMSMDNETNEVWEYSIVGDRNQWRRLMDESTPGNDITPRSHFCSVKLLGSDFVYLFGGSRNNGSEKLVMNDLWEYDVQRNTISVLKDGENDTIVASDSLNISFSGYTLNDFNDDLLPPHRYDQSCWVDYDMNLYIFGGVLSSLDSSNDVWMYNRTISKWGFIFGGGGVEVVNNFGSSSHSFDLGNIPATRSGALSFPQLIDYFEENVMIFYGGYSSIGHESNFLSDMWQFSNTLKQFKFVNGSSSFNEISEPNANVLGGRAFGVGIVQRSRQLLLFGGSGIAN